MNKWYIADVKCDAIGGGPFPGTVVAEAKIQEDGDDTFYMSLVEFDSMPNFYKSDESLYELHLNEDFDEEISDKLEGYIIASGEYDDFFEEPDEEWDRLFRYLVYIVRGEWEETESYISDTVGKYLDEIEIPRSDVEEDYYEENE